MLHRRNNDKVINSFICLRANRFGWFSSNRHGMHTKQEQFQFLQSAGVWRSKNSSHMITILRKYTLGWRAVLKVGCQQLFYSLDNVCTLYKTNVVIVFSIYLRSRILRMVFNFLPHSTTGHVFCIVYELCALCLLRFYIPYLWSEFISIFNTPPYEYF